MSVPAIAQIKVEQTDEEESESSCIDLMFPPYYPESQDVNSCESKSHVLKNLKRDFSEVGNPASAGCGSTNESAIDSPTNSTESEEHVNCYDNKFDVLKQPKREFMEVETPDSSYNFTNGSISERTLTHSDSKEHINPRDNKFNVTIRPKKEFSEKENPKKSCTLANKKVYEENVPVLQPVVVKQEIPCEYNEYEELFLSVKVKKGDRKYQGKRKTEGLNNQQGNTSIHYDVLVTNKEVSCKFCDSKFKNSLNLLKHNIEHLKLEINTPDVIKKFQNKIKNNSKKLEKEKRSYNKRGEHKTKILYHCKLCNKHYKYRSWYKHQETVHSEKKYKCGLCGKKFGCFVYVENHMKVVHVVKMYQEKFERMFRCWCGKEFRSQTNLDIHKKERHNMIGHNYTPINVGFL